jgi:DNA polymerase-4
VRKIIHVDMDAFYASVEQRDYPSLKGRPVIVGGSPGSRGVVCAASYEARPFGVHSAMPSAQAARLCPQAVFLRPDFGRYKRVSGQVMEIFHRYTDLVEPLSLDEAFLDVTDNRLGIPHATRVAKEIRAAIRAELRLTASAGVAPNKFLAKVASDLHKPDGLCVITPDRVEEFLRTLPVRKLPGVGPVTAQRFERAGVRLVADIRRLDERELGRLFGRSGLWFAQLARGVDDRPVEPHRERKSVGVEETFERDVWTVGEAERQLGELAPELERRLERSGFRGRTVTLKVRYADFRRISRSRTLGRAVTDGALVLEVARELLRETEVGTLPARLLGLAVSHADAGPEQLRLPYEGYAWRGPAVPTSEHDQ